MKLKLAFGAGFATGYYFGTKAGRERYEQINAQLEALRHHPKVEAVTDKITNAVDAQVDKAKDAVATTVKAKVDSVVDTARSVLPGGAGANLTGAPGAGPTKTPADGSANGTATIPMAANPSASACN